MRADRSTAGSSGLVARFASNALRQAIGAGLFFATTLLLSHALGIAGYGEYFIHRTGHSIATDIHANGANMDDLEIHDERQILPNSFFSIEPGIYMPEFGVRSEVNMLVRAGSAEVTGKIQSEIVTI